MTEEQVTKSIIRYLITNKWKIIAFDFPQSGTGIMLHPDDNSFEKNKYSIIPDIVAVKKDLCLFFENKNRSSKSDFKKIHMLQNQQTYYKSIAKLLEGYNVHEIYYGIGLPAFKYSNKTVKLSVMVDFVIGVNQDLSAVFLFNPKNIVI